MPSVSSGCYIIDADYNVIDVNETAQATYPQLKTGEKCYACLMGLDRPCGPCPVANHRLGPQLYRDPIRNIAETVDAVDITLPGHGDCHALIFTTVAEYADLSATLPTTANMLQDLALIRALTLDYIDVFSVSTADDRITLYRHNGKPVESTDANKSIGYTVGTERYISRYVIPEDRQSMRELNDLKYITECLKFNESMTVHYRVLIDGEKRHYFRKIVRVGNAENFGQFIVGVGCEDDEIFERRRREKLEKDLNEVEIDQQTGLYTKEAFFLHSEELLKAYPDTDFDFCISKIDNLNLINHQYGRVAGGSVIELVGKKLLERSTSDNCIGYFGDGYFASYTPTEPRDSRKAAVSAFRDSVLADCEIRNVLLKWSIYIGVPKGLSAEETYEKTRYALSIIRESSDEEYIEFDQAVIDRMEWEEQVRSAFADALENHEFQVWYQPKYSSGSMRIIGAEALARWIRPDGTVITPDRFIPILEKWGMIHKLDEYVFRHVCELQAKLSGKGKDDLQISVNLSRASFFTRELAENYAGIVEECGIDPACVPIEITESAAVRAQTVRGFATRLLSHGFRFEMDDFGSGYTSLASLQIITFTSIKLDKSLVDFIGIKSGESLLKHTISFAKESGKNVIAEGVETSEQFLFLKSLGCDAIQGYYFSKPVCEEEFLRMLEI